MPRTGTGPPVPPLVLRQVTTGAAALAARDLLELEHPLPDGWLLAFADLAADPRDPPVAAALAVHRGKGTVELRRFGVNPTVPEATVIPRLLAILADSFRAAGCRRVVTAVPPEESARLAALEAAGFRPAGAQLELSL